ncbi:lipid II flippase MurJ [Microbacterium aquimaris]|uniref:murein biosynthesis integral membrane protein MurJ n=1 Tax=Microbacterium aquimaris TaxID=459816 RepID=UPI002AD318EF|nr:lipid II flippase MurJ [Microbacterium aquimaris]MDZ8274823.1 lipid II flippase MurJ [Microbacterium aquimaris]
MRRGFLSLFSGNLAGKVLGLLREVVLAALFGTSTTVGAYRVANTGTFVAVNFFTADAISVGFLPNYSRFLKSDRRAATIYLATVQRILFVLAVAVALTLTFGRDVLAYLLAPGLSSPALSLAADMLGVMAIATPFYVYVNLASYIEIAHGRYTIASTRPAAQSVGLIGGTFVAFYLGEPLWLAGGFLTAYALLSVWAFSRVRGSGYTARSHFGANPPSRRERRDARVLFFKTVAPVMWIPLILQGGGVAERAIASFVSESAVAALDYARLISETTQVLIAAPLGIIMLASLGTLSEREFKSSVSTVGNTVLLVCVPLSGLLVVVSEPLITLVYGRGAFGDESIAVTSSILTGLSIGLWAHTLSYTHIKALNSRGRNKEASIAVGAGALSMVIADLLLVPQLGAFALGLGWSVGAVARLAITTSRLGQLVAVGRRLGLLIPVALAATAVWLFNTSVDAPWSLLGAVTYTLVCMGLALSIPSLRRELSAIVRKKGAGPADPE